MRAFSKIKSECNQIPCIGTSFARYHAPSRSIRDVAAWLRGIAAELAKLGFVNQRGAMFSASSVQSMVE